MVSGFVTHCFCSQIPTWSRILLPNDLVFRYQPGHGICDWFLVFRYHHGQEFCYPKLWYQDTKMVTDSRTAVQRVAVLISGLACHQRRSRLLVAVRREHRWVAVLRDGCDFSADRRIHRSVDASRDGYSCCLLTEEYTGR